MIPVNLSAFEKELETFTEGKESKRNTSAAPLQIPPDFLKKKGTKRLGKYTVHSANSVTTRSMSSSKTIGTITWPADTTQENNGTPKLMTSSAAASTSTATDSLSQCMPKEQSMDADIGQINLHLTNVNKSLLDMNTGNIDIFDGEIVKHVHKLGQICKELGRCCSNMEAVIVTRINCKKSTNQSDKQCNVADTDSPLTDPKDNRDFLQENF